MSNKASIFDEWETVDLISSKKEAVSVPPLDLLAVAEDLRDFFQRKFGPNDHNEWNRLFLDSYLCNGQGTNFDTSKHNFTKLMEYRTFHDTHDAYDYVYKVSNIETGISDTIKWQATYSSEAGEELYSLGFFKVIEQTAKYYDFHTGDYRTSKFEILKEKK